LVTPFKGKKEGKKERGGWEVLQRGEEVNRSPSAKKEKREGGGSEKKRWKETRGKISPTDSQSPPQEERETENLRRERIKEIGSTGKRDRVHQRMAGKMPGTPSEKSSQIGCSRGN